MEGSPPFQQGLASGPQFPRLCWEEAGLAELWVVSHGAVSSSAHSLETLRGGGVGGSQRVGLEPLAPQQLALYLLFYLLGSLVR